MLIQLKNKDTLCFDDFIFQCTIGKKGISSKKKEWTQIDKNREDL